MHLSEAPFLVLLGFMFLVGLGADLIGRHTVVPRVTLLILSGLLIGPAGLDLLPRDFVSAWFPPLTTIALALVGFLLGQKMSIASLRARGKLVTGITIGETAGALLAVAVGLILLDLHPAIALLLAGIAPATAPAAIFDIVHEGRFKGPVADTLLSVVAVDDALGLLLFSLMMAGASMLIDGGSAMSNFLGGTAEVGGSILLGVALGIPMAFLTGRISKGEPTLAEALGFILLCGGIATWLHLSSILSAMIMGAVVASLARHHKRPFHAIEGIEWPFLILFFMLAGASAHIEALLTVGAVTLVYMLFRCAGMYAGARAGATWAGADPAIRRWLGLCLFPQAGVALGMTLMASQRFPQFADVLLPVVLASTIIYELLTPTLCRRALQAAGAKIH
jgi:Kef-type K+ transport system membrane component KefB